MREWFTLPRRHSSQPQAKTVYTFIASQTEATPSLGTAYVLNSRVLNKTGALRYTITTANGETSIKDRDHRIVARIDWNHARYPRIEYRQSGKVKKCKKWIPYGTARLTRTIHVDHGRTYRWTRLEGEDMFAPKHSPSNTEPPIFADVNEDDQLMVSFRSSDRDKRVKDAIVVALVLLRGEKRWLKMGQFGPKDVQRMKLLLKIGLGLTGLGRSIMEGDSEMSDSPSS